MKRTAPRVGGEKEGGGRIPLDAVSPRRSVWSVASAPIPGVLTSTSEAGRTVDIIWRRVLENIIRAWCTQAAPAPLTNPPYRGASYFNRTRAWLMYLRRRRVLPNYPQCRLLLIELSIPVPWLSGGILDFLRISMRRDQPSAGFFRIPSSFVTVLVSVGLTLAEVDGRGRFPRIDRSNTFAVRTRG